ncbi:MAG: hypothetical protein OEX21_12820 [Betaproteobacteria bacterium]|nr:hypothetical protein [Betaproteobacteria bacterium]
MDSVMAQPGPAARTMLFALARDGGVLLAFASAAQAAAHCKGSDVKASAWRFYADDGSPLEPRFERAARPGGAIAVSDAYSLQRAMSGLWLQERLEQVRRVEGCGLATVTELTELLKINRGKRIPPPSRRGPG